MDNSDDEYAIRLLVIKDDVVCVLMSPATWRKLVGLAAQFRIVGEQLKASGQSVSIILRLRQTERLEPVKEHVKQISGGISGEPIFIHS